MTEPTKAGREGDTQPMPVVNDSPDIQSMVIADIEARREVGIKRYGTALQPHNGRDALQDAYEEAIDLAMYLKQAIVERDTPQCDFVGETVDGWMYQCGLPTGHKGLHRRPTR